MGTEKTYIKTLIKLGYSVELNRVCLCDLRNHVKRYEKERPYQVHCDAGERFSEVYSKIDDAINKFFEIVEKRTNNARST